MKLKEREALAGELLDARGWLSCWVSGWGMPKHHDNDVIAVRAGNLTSSIEKIDKVLKKLGHKGNGRCH